WATRPKQDVSPSGLLLLVDLLLLGLNSDPSQMLLVGSVVIDIGLGREDHGSILRNCDRRGELKSLDVRTDSRTRLDGSVY
ncbi:hypothetical protein A2U01_0046917, partial [Trifolium medium]|nr:hypothetical protein [Trifolium medium]